MTISIIGLTLYLCEAMNAPKNSAMLVRIWMLYEPKFSWFIRTNAAAANSPTTPGRRPLNTDAMTGCFWYFRKNLLISSHQNE